MKTGSIWIHKVSRDKYSILNDCKMRMPFWVEAVIYMRDNKFYVRSVTDFLENFEPHDKIGLDSNSSKE